MAGYIQYSYLDQKRDAAGTQAVRFKKVGNGGDERGPVEPSSAIC